MDLAVIKRIFKRACPLLGLCNLLHLYLFSDKSIFFEIGIERSLHKAAISGEYETIKVLLESGGDVDLKDQVLFQSFFVIRPARSLKRVIKLP